MYDGYRDPHLAYRGLAEAGVPSVCRGTRGAGCSGGTPGSSHKANSPAEAKVREHKVTSGEHKLINKYLKSDADLRWTGKEASHLDLLLQEVDLVLLLDQLLLLFSNLRKTHTHTHTFCLYAMLMYSQIHRSKWIQAQIQRFSEHLDGTRSVYSSWDR